MGLLGTSKTLEQVYGIALPARTKSYEPVPHKVLIESLKERLDKRNMSISTERYSLNDKGTQMFGCFSIQGEDGGQEMALGFRNSYDKSLAVGLVCGSNVIVCSNLMFEGDLRILRKHTTNVWNDLENLSDNAMNYMDESFKRILKDTERWKEIECSKRTMAELAGRLFIEDEIINSTQLNIIKKEIDYSQNFKDQNLWAFHNNLTEVLKTCPPITAININLKAHNWTRARVLELQS